MAHSLVDKNKKSIAILLKLVNTIVSHRRKKYKSIHTMHVHLSIGPIPRLLKMSLKPRYGL